VEVPFIKNRIFRVIIDESGRFSFVFKKINDNFLSQGFSEVVDSFHAIGTEIPDRGSSIDFKAINIDISILLSLLNGFNIIATLSEFKSIIGLNNIGKVKGIGYLCDVIFLICDKNDSQGIKLNVLFLKVSLIGVRNVGYLNK